MPCPSGANGAGDGRIERHQLCDYLMKLAQVSPGRRNRFGRVERHVENGASDRRILFVEVGE
jgi:hypothetical protein